MGSGKDRLARFDPGLVPTADPNASSEAIFSDLTQLRKRYDDLLAYALVLMGEKDYLKNELEETQKELAKEVAKRPKPGQDAVGDSSVDAPTTEMAPKEAPFGFSFTWLVAVALVAFAL